MRPSPKERLLSKIAISERGCWEWTGSRDDDGYGWFWMHGVNLAAHRASWIIHYGEIPAGKLVCHTCDNPPCINPNHLFVGTQQDNSTDSKVKGRTLRGLNHPRAVMTPEIAAAIRDRYEFRKVTHRMLAQEFGICRNTVQKVLYDRIYC